MLMPGSLIKGHGKWEMWPFPELSCIDSLCSKHLILLLSSHNNSDNNRITDLCHEGTDLCQREHFDRKRCDMLLHPIILTVNDRVAVCQHGKAYAYVSILSSSAYLIYCCCLFACFFNVFYCINIF